MISNKSHYKYTNKTVIIVVIISVISFGKFFNFIIKKKSVARYLKLHIFRVLGISIFLLYTYLYKVIKTKT